MLFTTNGIKALSLALCLGLITSCAKREESDTTLSSDTTVTTTGSDRAMTGDSSAYNTTGNAMGGGSNNMGVNPASMNDGNIIAFMSMSDSMEIALGNMAKSKARNSEVKEFGQTMVTEHTRMKKEGEALAQKQNITPMMPAGLMMPPEMTAQLDALKNASGAAFDSLYVNNQIAMHEMTLNVINAANPQDMGIRGLIDKARPHILEHLEAARRLQGQLSNASTATR